MCEIFSLVPSKKPVTREYWDKLSKNKKNISHIFQPFWSVLAMKVKVEKPGFNSITFTFISNYGQESLLEVIRQNIAGWCLQSFCFQKFVDNVQHCFAFTPQANFTAHITKKKLNVPEKPKLKCLGFTYNGAKLFNMLPLEMKKMEDPNIFKTKTKEWIWENIPSY